MSADRDDWTEADHAGELRESDYGFACWIVCSCGWRSRSYDVRRMPAPSAWAWSAHDAHRTEIREAAAR